MRKCFYLGMALCLALSSCSEEDQFGISGATFEDFTGEIFEIDSRTSMDRNGSVLWSEGDAISLFKKNGYHQKYNASTSGSSSTGFEYGGVSTENESLPMHYAVYPYSENNSVSGNTLTVDLSSLETQSYTATTFENGKAVMVAKSTTTQLPFTNAFSLANVKLTGEVNDVPGDDIYITKITVVSATKALNGAATIDMSQDKPVAVFDDNNGNKTITLSCKDDNDNNSKGVQLGTTPADFYILMPAATFPSGDLTVTIYATVSGEAKQREFNLKKTEGISFLRSKITTLTAEIELDDWSASTEMATEKVEDVDGANDAFKEGKAAVKLEDASGATTTAITVPAKATEAEADVEHMIDLSEAKMPTDGLVKIEVEEGTANEYTVEGITVVVPNDTSADGFEINAPGTTVTIKGTDGTVIATIVGATADETLVISNGITVTKLIIKKGNVRIEEGGSVENIEISSENVDGATFVTYEGAEAQTVAYVTTAEGFNAAIEKSADEIIFVNDITSASPLKVTCNTTIDGNDHKLNYTGQDRAIQITGGTVVIEDLTVNMPENTPEGSRGINLYNGDTNNAIDVKLDNVTVNGYKAYAVNIGGGKDNKLTIIDSQLTGYAAINVNEASVNHTIVVEGSTLNGKNHNNDYHFGTVVVDGSNEHSLTINDSQINTENLDGVDSEYYQVIVSANCTYTVCDGIEVAVRDVYEETKGLYHIGLASAIAVDNAKIKVLGNIEIADMIYIPSGKTITIDLNGKTITGTDNTDKNFSILDNRGTLNIINSSVEAGKLTLTATTNSGWSRYSAVLANNPGGNLTVGEGVVIEHLGGTDMAYGIDNLTNGKGTCAVTTIDGATIRSAYRAVRQFLNGVEATNELYIKSGIIQGENKSVWMHDPSKNANTGKLVIESNAQLIGDVYLFVTEGSTEWPVEVSIAKTALGESEVVTGNVPEGYEVVLNNGNYVIKKVFVRRVSTLEDLRTALTEAGSANAGYSTIYIDSNINMTDQSWTPISIDGYHGADIVTVEGGEHTITGLTAGLFAGGFAGGSGIIIKDLTIENSTIVANNTQGYGAFVGCADSMEEITLINCHLKNSSIITPNDGTDESRIGGLIGWTAGYNNQNDGPVDSYITVKNCSVEGCTLKGAGSIGGIVGHAGANAATFTTIENCTLTGNTFNSTDDGGWRVGVVVGTANNGQCIIKNITETNNTLSQTDKETPTGDKRNYYGRFVPAGTGTLTIDGVTITE